MEKFRICIYHIYIIYCVDPARSLHIVVKQDGKLYLGLCTNPKERFSLYAAHEICIYS